MPYTVAVDKDLCISSGKCVADAPQAFRFDADELSEVVDPSGLSDEERLDIARNCPSGAISVLDDAGDTLDIN